MITIAVILAILVALALLRFGVVALYGENGLFVAVRIGPVSLRILPARKRNLKKARKRDLKKARKAKEKKDKAKKRTKTKPEMERPGRLDMFFTLLSAVKTALGRLNKRLLINELTVHYTSGGPDPYRTAMSYGAASAVFAAAQPAIDSIFRIKRSDLRVKADFESGKQQVYVKARASLAVWEAVYITFALLPAIIKMRGKPKQ